MGPPGSVSGHAMTCGNAVTRRSFARIRWSVRRHPLAVPRPVEEERALRVPPPARLEERRCEDGLDEDARARWRDSGSRRPRRSSKLCCGPSERTIASSFAAAWSSKPKPTQKRFRSARPHARLIFEPNGACTTSCMPPLSSKKRSRMTRFCVGTAPSAWRPGLDVLGDLDGGAFGQRLAAFGIRKCRGRSSPAAAHSLPQVADLRRELARPAGRLAEPERKRRRLALRVRDADDAGLDPDDAPRRVAELEDVAAVGLDGPVLVDGPDERAFRLEPHLVVGGVGNRAAGHERREAGALRPHAGGRSRRRGAAAPVGRRCGARRRGRTPRAKAPDRARPSARGRRARAPPTLRRHAGRDDLLREDVERARRHRRAVEDRAPDATSRSAAPSTSSSSVSGKSRPFGIFRSTWPERPTRWRNVAIERVAPTWIARSTSPMSIPSSSDAVATSARSVPAFRRCSASRRRALREAAVVARHGVLAEEARELRRRCARPSCACSRRRASCGARG